MQATGIILAGGKSSRMGTNKALLKIEGKTVIERAVENLIPVVEDIIVVTNAFEEFSFLKLPMVEDKWKGMGPLAGIHSGLTASSSERNLIVACDMPFISPRLGEILLNQLSEYEAAVPEIAGQLHPLFAAYRKEVTTKAEQALEENQLRIRSLLNRLHAKILTEKDLEHIDFRLKSEDLFNMNYPSEYEQAQGMTIK